MQIELKLKSYAVSEAYEQLIKKVLDDNPEMTITELSQLLGIGKTTLYRDINKLNLNLPKEKHKAVKVISENNVNTSKANALNMNKAANPFQLMASRYLSINQIQAKYGISRNFIYQLRREGKLKFYYLNTKPFVSVSEFDALMIPETNTQ